MKLLFPLFILLILGAVANADSAACRRAANVASGQALIKKAPYNNCFVRYVQTSNDNPNLYYLRWECDPAGAFIYRVWTIPHGGSCTVTRVSSKSVP